MLLHMEYEWFSAEHFGWMAALGFPMLAVWVIGAPSFAFIALFRNRRMLDDSRVMKYTLLLYQGLKPSVFYWEFINISKKFLVLWWITFLSQYNTNYQILSASTILVLSVRIQIWLQPYKQKENNNVEILGNVASIITLYSGIIHTDDGSVMFISVLAMIFIILSNSLFILKWIFLLIISSNIKNKTIRRVIDYIRAVFMKRSTDYSLQSPRHKHKHKHKIRPKTKKKNHRKLVQHQAKKIIKRQRRKFPDEMEKKVKFEEISQLSHPTSLDSLKPALRSKSKESDDSFFYPAPFTASLESHTNNIEPQSHNLMNFIEIKQLISKNGPIPEHSQESVSDNESSNDNDIPLQVFSLRINEDEMKRKDSLLD